MSRGVPGLLLALALLAGGVGLAGDRQTAAEGRFRFEYPAGMRESLADLVGSAEGVRRRLAHDYGTDGPPVIVVRVARDLKEFAALQPTGVRVPSWAVGTAHPRHSLIVLNHGRTQAGTLADTSKVFAHEMSHLMLAHAVGFRRVPRWFDEGLAVRAAREWGFWRGRVIIGPALTGKLIPLRKLARGFPVEAHGAQLAYAQSVEFVTWLVDEYGAERLQRLLAMLRGEKPFFDALQEATGERVEALEQAWISHLKLRFNWLPLLTSSAVIWFIGAVIFLLAYGRRRIQRQRKLAAMAADEAALERVITAADHAEQRAGAAEDFDDRGPPPGTTVH